MHIKYVFFIIHWICDNFTHVNEWIALNATGVISGSIQLIQILIAILAHTHTHTHDIWHTLWISYHYIRCNWMRSLNYSVQFCPRLFTFKAFHCFATRFWIIEFQSIIESNSVKPKSILDRSKSFWPGICFVTISSMQTI